MSLLITLDYQCAWNSCSGTLSWYVWYSLTFLNQLLKGPRMRWTEGKSAWQTCLNDGDRCTACSRGVVGGWHSDHRDFGHGDRFWCGNNGNISRCGRCHCVHDRFNLHAARSTWCGASIGLQFHTISYFLLLLLLSEESGTSRWFR